MKGSTIKVILVFVRVELLPETVILPITRTVIASYQIKPFVLPAIPQPSTVLVKRGVSVIVVYVQATVVFLFDLVTSVHMIDNTAVLETNRN